jgi:hypothetical protein
LIDFTIAGLELTNSMAGVPKNKKAEKFLPAFSGFG